MHNDVIENYLLVYKNNGEEKLFKHVIGNAILISTRVPYPEILLLDQSDEFFVMFRRTGDNNYFEIGRVLRRAAHKIYREFAKTYKNNNLDYPINAKFLNIVK